MKASKSEKKYIDHPKAIQACQFFERLTLIGDYSGERWRLEGFQRDWISELYGTRTPDGSRNIDKVSLWMPRGLGKTQQAAGIAVYELIFGPPGREVYAAGPDRDKASRIYKAMAEMIRRDPDLEELCDLSDHYLRIKVPSKNSIFLAIAADQDQGHSLAPSTLILDELHLWKSRKLYDALTSGGHKRKQGSLLEIQISTAGDTKSGLAWDLYSYAKSVRDGLIEDPNMLVRIFEAPPDADWTDPAVWRTAMPCSYVNFDAIAKQCELAKHIKHQEMCFRQLYLGQWLEHSATKWLDPSHWAACGEDYTEEDLHGERAVAGLDLSCVRDLTSMTLFFPDSKRVLSWSWLPSEGIAEREDKDKTSYRAWQQSGYLNFTSGSRIDHSEVAEDINNILQRFDVTRFVADPFSLNLIAPYLTMEPERYQQQASYMSPPSKWLEVAISKRDIRHNNNPLVNWCAGNVVIDTDKYENIFPHKTKSTTRIDPIVALIMAIGAWLGDGGGESADCNETYKDLAAFVI